MGKRIVFEEKNCTLCHMCAMFCSLAFGPQGIYAIRPAIARIRPVESPDGARYVAHVCLQCEIPDCVEACPVEAISVAADTGIVMIDDEACTGCEACVEACAFGGVFMADGIAVKCEVCDDPLCVRACSEKALRLEDTCWEAVLVQGELYKEVPL
jgi:carbon-monoxide dehydrogenase iron sulfur subunit